MADKKITYRELLLSAIKGEKQAARLYSDMAESTENPLFKERLLLLAREEQRHRENLEEMLGKKFGDRYVGPAKLQNVELLVTEGPGEASNEMELLIIAMRGERAAEEFYRVLAEQYPQESEERWLLSYFAMMENGHFQLLATERLFSESHPHRKMKIR